MYSDWRRAAPGDRCKIAGGILLGSANSIIVELHNGKMGLSGLSVEMERKDIGKGDEGSSDGLNEQVHRHHTNSLNGVGHKYSGHSSGVLALLPF